MTTHDAENLRRGIPEISAVAECEEINDVNVTDGLKSTTAYIRGISPEYLSLIHI